MRARTCSRRQRGRTVARSREILCAGRKNNFRRAETDSPTT